MKTHDFYFDLPQELIAQTPLARRDGSRLLVLDKTTGAVEHRHFYDLPEYLHPGDCLILNNSRVLPARLLGHRVPGGGACEILLLIDRGDLCAQITPGAQQSANAPIPPGISDADGSDFAAHNGADGNGAGYYSADYAANCQQAVALLRQAAESSGRFTVNAQGVCAGFPELTYLTSDAAGHVAIAEYLRALYARYGSRAGGSAATPMAPRALLPAE